MIAGLVLAAGAGSRLGGRPKALLPYRGGLLIEHAIRTLAEGGCEPIFAVLGAADTPPLAGAVKVHNPQWAAGMGSSLRAGLQALPTEVSLRPDDEVVEAVIIMLVDQPGITPEAVRRVRQAPGAIAVATYHQRQGHPVMFRRAWWKEIAESAQGDKGARDFLRAHPELITPVPCDDIADPADIDLEEDLPLLDR